MIQYRRGGKGGRGGRGEWRATAQGGKGRGEVLVAQHKIGAVENHTSVASNTVGRTCCKYIKYIKSCKQRETEHTPLSMHIEPFKYVSLGQLSTHVPLKFRFGD